MNIPTWEESHLAVLEGYADPIHAFINEHEPITDELFRSDLQVLLEDLVQTEAKKWANHYAKILLNAMEAAVLVEREACAKLCEEYTENNGDQGVGTALVIFEAIKQRGEENE